MNQPGEQTISRGKLLVLGETMGRVGLRVQEQVAATVPASFAVGSMIEIVQHYTGLLPTLLQRMRGRLDGVREILTEAGADELEVRRAVGRFESTLEEMLGGYYEIRRLAATGVDVEARDLLAAGYAHCLLEIATWLRTLGDGITRSETAPDTSATAPLGPSLALAVSPAPEFQQLTLWVERRVLEANAPPPDPGMLATIGEKVKGWKIGGRLFGGPDRRNRR